MPHFSLDDYATRVLLDGRSSGVKMARGDAHIRIRLNHADRDRLKEVAAKNRRTNLRIKPTGIVPLGPEIAFSAPHGRG